MTTNNVVNLGRIRNLLAEWDQVREHIIAGSVDGWAATIRNVDGRESVYIGGVYRSDSRLMLSAALRMSTARMMEEDEPPQFASSQF